MDKRVELAYLKIMPNGVVFKSDIFFNPEMKISEEAIAVHGITDGFLLDKPIFREKSQELWEIFRDCYYGGYNVMGFDLPLLRREFIRVGIDFEYANSQIIDSKVIYHYMEPRTLSAAYKYYCGKEHVDAHSALGDVEVTAEVLIKQLEQYQEIRDWNFIYEMHNPQDGRYVDNERKFYWRSGEAYFAFSKFRDYSLASVAKTDRGFLEWIMTADFSEETKSIVKKAMEGEFPIKEKKE
jgi:DNA polymerase-3 subunit epsilon